MDKGLLIFNCFRALKVRFCISSLGHVEEWVVSKIGEKPQLEQQGSLLLFISRIKWMMSFGISGVLWSDIQVQKERIYFEISSGK